MQSGLHPHSPLPRTWREARPSRAPLRNIAGVYVPPRHLATKAATTAAPREKPIRPSILSLAMRIFRSSKVASMPTYSLQPSGVRESVCVYTRAQGCGTGKHTPKGAAPSSLKRFSTQLFAASAEWSHGGTTKGPAQDTVPGYVVQHLGSAFTSKHGWMPYPPRSESQRSS